MSPEDKKAVAKMEKEIDSLYLYFSRELSAEACSKLTRLINLEILVEEACNR